MENEKHNQTKQPSVSTAMSKPLPGASDSEIAMEMARMAANWPSFSISPATVGVWKVEWRRIADRYGFSTLQETVTQFIREPGDFPPTPGKILERCEQKWPDGPPKQNAPELVCPDCGNSGFVLVKAAKVTAAVRCKHPKGKIRPVQEQFTDAERSQNLKKLAEMLKNFEPSLAKKEPKAAAERQELHEVQSKGMKAKVIDRKAEAANDK